MWWHGHGGSTGTYKRVCVVLKGLMAAHVTSAIERNYFFSGTTLRFVTTQSFRESRGVASGEPLRSRSNSSSVTWWRNVKLHSNILSKFHRFSFSTDRGFNDMRLNIFPFSHIISLFSNAMINYLLMVDFQKIKEEHKDHSFSDSIITLV